MSSLDIFLATAGAVLTVLSAGYAFLRGHHHPEHPTHKELDGLRVLMRSQHDAVLRELDALRQRQDELLQEILDRMS